MFKLVWRAFLVVIVVTAVGLAFMLGVSFGLSNNHDKFISETVPVLSMLGGWVSGIGALAAVLATLWLADKQRRGDVEHLRVSMSMGLVNPDYPWFIGVQVVADGNRPATVRSLTFTSPHAQHAVHITGFLHFGSQLPVQLSYGEKAEFNLEYGTGKQLKDFVDRYCAGKPNGLKVVVSTNLNSFSAKVDPNFLTLDD
jgi:hypothetical protein